jgi:bacteriorhodopsin
MALHLPRVVETSSTPGFYLIFLWLVFVCCLWVMFNAEGSRLAGFTASAPKVTVDSKHLLIDRDSVSTIFAAWGFFIATVYNLISVFLRPLKKLQQCTSIVLYIDFVALTTYTILSFNWFPDIQDGNGEIFDWIHYLEWAFTTPAMIFLLGTLGTSMEDKLINNRTLVFRAIFLDECTILLGFTSKLLSGSLRWICLAASFAAFILLCRSIGAIIAHCMRTAGSLLDFRVLRTMEWITYFTWSLFGVFQVLILMRHHTPV